MKIDHDIKGSLILFNYEFSVRSQLIYCLTLCSILIALISLPFILITISVHGNGSVQSSIERVQLLIPGNGKVTFINTNDNKKVKKGEVLLKVDASVFDQQKSSLSNQINNINDQIHDVTELLNKKSNVNLRTGLYRANFQEYRTQIEHLNNVKDQALKLLNRHQILYAKQVITLAEFEEFKFRFVQAQSEVDLMVKKYKSQWQAEAIRYFNDRIEMQNKIRQIEDEQKHFILTATIGGTLQNLKGIQVGTFVFSNQVLAEILPDSNLLGYCYVKSSDIGLIRTHQKVRFKIDAFNYNQWGFLEGKVLEISEEVALLDAVAYFKVKCMLNKRFLQLKNGCKGNLRKGMTFQAQFDVTQRSLYQLLYDRIDDWINPSQKQRI